MRLKKKFFNRDTNVVARELLGKKIVRDFGDGKKLEAIITETEAYHGFEDKASHASKKKTERNKIMFEKAGLVYVYLIYGMHYCLNFTTMPKGFPAAVLIRAIALPESRIMNHELWKETKGPGRVCKTLQIDKSLYGEDLSKGKKIWVEDGVDIEKKNILTSKRIGVDYAKECKDWEWNYKIVL